MPEEHLDHKDNVAVSQIKRHQLTIFLVVSISIALFLVYISLSLYRSSGTMQLDLSRPGFDEARKEVVNKSTVFHGFASEGEVSKATLEEFNKLYGSRFNDATAIDAFAGDALSDKTLNITK